MVLFSRIPKYMGPLLGYYSLGKMKFDPRTPREFGGHLRKSSFTAFERHRLYGITLVIEISELILECQWYQILIASLFE